MLACPQSGGMGMESFLGGGGLFFFFLEFFLPHSDSVAESKRVVLQTSDSANNDLAGHA